MSELYELSDETKEVDGVTLHRLVFKRDFNRYSKGDKGGWVQSLDNVQEYGEVSKHSTVYGNALVTGHGRVFGDAIINGDARILDYAKVFGGCKVGGCAIVRGVAKITSNAIVKGRARILGDADISSDACIRSPNDFITIANLGYDNSTLTAYKTMDGGINCKFDLKVRPLNDFKEFVEDCYISDKKRELKLAIKLIKQKLKG